MICYLYDAPQYLFFASDIPELLYYATIPTSITALLLGLFVFLHNKKELPNLILLLLSICFVFYSLITLFAWTSIKADLLAFMWPAFAIISALISILSVYFTYTFLYKKDVPFAMKLLFFALLAPVIIFSITDLSFSGFNLANCDAFDFEGLAYKAYYTILGFVAMFWILGLLIRSYLSADAAFKPQIIRMGIGIEFYLFFFTTITFLSTYLTSIGYFENSDLELYGFFGMAFFLVMMGILIVRFRSFNVGAHIADALTIALVILVASQYTYVNTRTGIVLTSITLALTGIAGSILIRSVRKESKQKKELEELTGKLEKANVRLKKLDKLKSEFVSIASHQLRSPLTSIRGYASMLLDGSYGKLPKKAQNAAQRIADSAKNMAYSIEDYLSVSRIESGNMKYNYSDFNLKDEAEKIADDLRPVAIKQGLGLIFRSDLKSRGVIHADIGKVIQIIQNLVNNSIKYTPEGSIKILVRDDAKKKKIYVDVEDTGIGMSEESLANLFGKFERAANANSTNIHGTGLGLFVAHQMATAMGGDITATSEGEGKGSRFTFEFPLAM